jgi:hypothetical protein
VRTAYFFLTLKQALDVDGQHTGSAEIGLQRFDVGEELSLVITRAAPVKDVSADSRFKRGELPFIERVRWLHIVMPVNENRRTVRRALPLSIDERMAFGGYDIDLVQTNSL